MRLQARLALLERQRAQVLLPVEQQVEDEEDQIACLALGDRRLQGGEVRRAGVVQRHHLAVDDAVRQLGAGRDDLLELVRPVEALAGQERGLAALGAQLHAVAVELDLVRPAGP